MVYDTGKESIGCGIQVSVKGAKEDEIIDFLQNELHEIVYSYVNGGFSNKGFMLYPLVKDLSSSNKRKISYLRKVAEALNERGYDFSSTLRLFKKTSLNSGNAPWFISCLYNDFSVARKPKTKLETAKCKKLDFDRYAPEDKEYLKPVLELKKFADRRLREFLVDLHIHGSIGTGDYIKGWSDLDTLIIIRKKVLANPKSLVKLRDLLYMSKKYFYKIDPLQHHGHMVVTEHDLGYYCQTFFPSILFKYSKSAFGISRLDLRVRNSERENAKRFCSFTDYFRGICLNKKFSMGSYELKFLFHAVALFPTIYLQAKGMHIYKKFSFAIARKDFDDALWNPIDEVTGIRKKWKSPGEMPLIGAVSGINPLLAYQINSKYLDIFNKIKKCNDFNIKKIITGMYDLSESALKKIKAEDIVNCGNWFNK
ncbi:nucleotidyltransferase domain-containing protein [Candidatus Woesearchaeota archaeon]|nr:nucleotidyltransferase domain-containing protein [Candidatus Woesearchaeota archaeon]